MVTSLSDPVLAVDKTAETVELLGDSNYDTNQLHEKSSQHGLRLIAPRKRPGSGLGWRKHHPNRIESIRLTEAADEATTLALQRARDTVERFFGAMATVGGGLAALPAWARRQHRVELWVGAKLAINAARISLRSALPA